MVPHAEGVVGVQPGATAVELLLPLALKHALEEHHGLSDMVQRLTAGPASIMGVDAGHLAIGHQADIAIFDPTAFWRVERSALKSQGKNTPFLGFEVPGRIRYTLVNGQVVFES